jgi:hypothetical protein
MACQSYGSTGAVLLGATVGDATVVAAPIVVVDVVGTAGTDCAVVDGVVELVGGAAVVDAEAVVSGATASGGSVGDVDSAPSEPLHPATRTSDTTTPAAPTDGELWRSRTSLTLPIPQEGSGMGTSPPGARP